MTSVRRKSAEAEPGRRRCRGRMGLWEAWSIQAPNAKSECSANKDCPQAFHALRAAANEKQPNEPIKTEIRDAVRVHHRKRTNRTRRSLENAKPARTLSNPLPPRFHPDFDHRETQLLVGQTAARCGLQSGKSARRLFSMQHLKAIRALAPLSTSGALPPCPRKIRPTSSQATAAHAFVGRTETSLDFIERAQAEPLSAKADGKPPALPPPPISSRLRAKTIEADLMSRHVPLLRWTHACAKRCRNRVRRLPMD